MAEPVSTNCSRRYSSGNDFQHSTSGIGAVGGQPELEPEPEQEIHRPAPPLQKSITGTSVHHIKVSKANVRRFPTLARCRQLGDATYRARPASARYGQPSNWTPNMRDLHNTRMLPQTDYDIIPPKVVSEHADFEQRMRTTQPVLKKTRFYPCNASAAREHLANSGSTSCLPPSLDVGPAWAFAGSPQRQPTVRHSIGGQDPPAKTMPPFRPSSASAARDQIKGRVTLFSADDKQRMREERRQREVARQGATEYSSSYPTAHRPQPRLGWVKVR